MEEKMPKRKTTSQQFQDLNQEIDSQILAESIQKSLANFCDSRQTSKTVYPFWYLFFIILLGYLSNCNTLADIACFADIKNKWINTILGVNFKSPSYSTLWWFFVRSPPQLFKAILSKWFQTLPNELRDKLLIIDGKRLKGASLAEELVHIVELFAAESQLVLAQERVPSKSGESKALPDLLESVDVQGALISMDALYANNHVLNKILECKADYLVALKSNQGTLYDEAVNFFEQAHLIEYEGVCCDVFQSLEKDHGRIETRHVCVTSDLDWLENKQKWTGIQCLIEVRSERQIGESKEFYKRYYYSSTTAKAYKFASWIRQHWAIENQLHWVADVIFREDASLNHCGYSAENIALVKRLAMNIVRYADPGTGLADARRFASFSDYYLTGLLAKIFVKKYS
jgi:predicted transposase YbfD/YdcC